MQVAYCSKVLAVGVAALTLIAAPAMAQSVRDFTRPKITTPSQLSEAQAAEVTLTLTDAQSRPIQTWVRAAGAPDASGRLVTITVRGAQAALIEPGQRLRAFSVNSRAQMQQGRVIKSTRTAAGATVLAELASPLFGNPSRCIVEIVTEAGPYLSIPNVSIIEEDGAQLVYLRQPDGSYLQRQIRTGIQGELYTQVLDGLSENDEVVSVGSFFVDADAKLKATGGMGAMAGMDHGAMDHSAMGQGSMQMSAPAAGSASGPLKLTMSDPSDTSTVAAPMMIHVMFNRPVDATKSTIEITGANGRVATDAPSTMGKDGLMLMVMPEKPLSPGRYKVKWRTAAANAEIAEGEFSFAVK